MAGLCEDTAEITVATTSKGSDNDPLLSSVLQVCCVVIGIVVQGGLVGRAESGADGPCFPCFTSALHHLAEARGARLGADIYCAYLIRRVPSRLSGHITIWGIRVWSSVRTSR
jgi:hypothetical protein